jgi:protein TonB
MSADLPPIIITTPAERAISWIDVASWIGSAATHVAVLGWLSYEIASFPLQIHFNRGRASVELQASIASAPPEETLPTPNIETPRPTEPTKVAQLEPIEQELERRPRELPDTNKPDAENPDRPKPIEVAVAMRMERPEEVEDEPLEIQPPPRRQLKQADPKVLESPVESVASDAARANSGDEESLPEPYATNKQPTYPADAYSRRQQGTVVLMLAIDGDGLVGNVWVSQSSGVPSLDNAAVAAARNWRYIPARRGGMSVAMTYKTHVNFSIRG